MQIGLLATERLPDRRIYRISQTGTLTPFTGSCVFFCERSQRLVAQGGKIQFVTFRHSDLSKNALGDVGSLARRTLSLGLDRQSH